jgi:hypothetical protein
LPTQEVDVISTAKYLAGVAGCRQAEFILSLLSQIRKISIVIGKTGSEYPDSTFFGRAVTSSRHAVCSSGVRKAWS